MKRIICLLFAVLFVVSFALSGCTEGEIHTPADTEVVTTEAAADNVDENGAKAIALEDAGIVETAANNLTVEFKDNTYVIAFEWSGFDYQYTVSAATGEIVEVLFDGDVI